MKKGAGIVSEPMIYFFLALFVVGVVVFGAVMAFGDVTLFAGILDIFRREENQNFSSSNIIGLILDDELSLAVFAGGTTGDGSWQRVDMSENSFSVGNRIFSVPETRLAFFDFYFKTLRKPPLENHKSGFYRAPSFVLSHDSSRALVVGGSANNPYSPEGLPGTYFTYHDLFVKETRSEPYISVQDDKYFRIRHKVFGANFDGFGVRDNVPNELYEGTFEEIDKWRNQILRGREFEKYLNVIFNILKTDGTSKGISNFYTVSMVRDSRNSPVIFVELDKNISNEGEKYDNLFIEEKKILVPTNHIIIDFDLKEGVTELFYGIPPGETVIEEHVWFVKGEDGNYHIISKDEAREFKTEDFSAVPDVSKGLLHVVGKLNRPGIFDYTNVKAYLQDIQTKQTKLIAEFDEVDSGSEEEELINKITLAYNAQNFEVINV